jgi:hypothetical protein
MRTNAVDRDSEVGTGTFADLTAPDSSAIGVIYHVTGYSVDASDERYGIRQKGSSRDVRWGCGAEHALAVSEADGNGVVQGVDDNASGTAWWEMGYFTAAAGPDVNVDRGADDLDNWTQGVRLVG